MGAGTSTDPAGTKGARIRQHGFGARACVVIRKQNGRVGDGGNRHLDSGSFVVGRLCVFVRGRLVRRQGCEGLRSCEGRRRGSE